MIKKIILLGKKASISVKLSNFMAKDFSLRNNILNLVMQPGEQRWFGIYDTNYRFNSSVWEFKL